MKLFWAKLAKTDLSQITAYIAQDNPAAAEQTASRILRSARLLARFPQIGREGRVTGTRERAVPNTPYLLVYKLSPAHIRILRVYHAARKWPARFPDAQP